MNSVNIGPYKIDIHQNAGIVCSGGADSSLLLYILMKYSTTPVHVYTLASKEKFRATSKVSADVIAKCMDLTGKSEVYHHVYYTDRQTFQTLFSVPNKEILDKKVSIVYTGITQTPPLAVMDQFKEKMQPDVQEERDPSIQQELYYGSYYRPFINFNKKNISQLYDALMIKNHLFPVTRSCESLTQSTGHCGECWWCEERQWAFGRLE